MRKLSSTIFFIIPLLLHSQNGIPSFVQDSLDIYVNRALKEWMIPGCAVGIIKDGKIIHTKGYGLRDSEGSELVDEHTLFMIASNTKAVTGITLAKLEQEKKLSLEDKVTKWLPWFSLYDKHATALANIKDMVTHRIGFETFQGDFTHWSTNTSRKEVIEKMAKIKPLYPFRDKWGYCNAGYNVAGEVIQLASGMKWEDYVTQNYFLPLGMTQTKALTVNFKSAVNHCTPHTIYKNKLIRMSIPNLDNLAPATSICSSIADWSKWVLMLLDEGKWNQSQIIPAKAIQISMQPVSVLGPFKPMFNSGNHALYGLGWQLLDYQGKKIVLHTGGADGFVTSVTLVPELELGILVFTNTDANRFYHALKWEILDAFLGLPYRDYSGKMAKTFLASEKQKQIWLEAVQDSVKNAKAPSIPLKRFTGKYTNEVYGNMTVQQHGDKLLAAFEHHPNQNAILEHMGNNRFLCTYSNPLLGIKVFPFQLVKNKVRSVTVSCDDFVEFTTYEFIHK